MRFAVAALLLGVLAAGCGGGDTTTVIERTVTVESGGGGAAASATGENDSAGEGDGGKTEEAAVERESAEEKAEEAGEPRRIIHLKTFRSPSGNIGCTMVDGGARCDIRKRDWSPPPRPASCSHQVDFGQGIAVSRNGEASFVCAGDTALDPGASSLAYGTASEVGGLECISREDGVTCVNRAGHGFFLSIQSYQVF